MMTNSIDRDQWLNVTSESRKNLLHSLGLVYKSMRGKMTNSIDRDQWLNVTSESRDRIQPFFLISPWVGIEPATLASLSRNGLP
jgi:hypothetical protein